MKSEYEPPETLDRSGIQAEVRVEDDLYARAAGRRIERTLALVDRLTAPILDMGPPNALARQMERRFSVRVEDTGQHDLDRESLADFRPGPYATITSFEILEHLLNPLFVLDGCRRILRDDGIVLITVPKRNRWEWLFGKSPEHFHEFSPDEIRWVVEKAGFSVEEYQELNTSPLTLGLRPLIRRMIRNTIFLKCRPS